MNLRKFIFGALSFFFVILWGGMVLLYASLHLHATETLKGTTLHEFAVYGTVMCFALFHGTWWVGTTSQTFLAFAMSDEIGESYVHMLLTKYKISLLFGIVDVIYIAFFLIKFWSVL